MDMRSVYEKFEGDYDGAISRLVSDERLEKYYTVFLKDTVVENLNTAYQEQDYQNAFMAAHTLKGNAQTLGFSKLGEAASVLTEALRHEDYSDLENQVRVVNEEYARVVGAAE